MTQDDSIDNGVAGATGDPETAEVMAALRRAARRARRRALELGDGMIPIHRDGEVVWIRADDESLGPLDDDDRPASP